MKQILSLCLLAIFIISCGNGNSEKTTSEKLSVSDSLFDEVLSSHDVVMPKMNKLSRLREKAEKQMDSLQKFNSDDATYKKKLDSVKASLDYAETAMNKWMQEFKYDSFKNNEAERIKYLQGEKEKVNGVKDNVLGSIQNAEKFFNP